MDAKALVKVNYSVPNTASMSARQTVEAHMARISFAQTLAQLQAKQSVNSSTILNPEVPSVAVKTGDTLSSIVKDRMQAIGQPVTDREATRLAQKVAKSNGLSDADKSYPGQRLQLGVLQSPEETMAAGVQAPMASTSSVLSVPFKGQHPVLEKTLERAVAKGFIPAQDKQKVFDKILNMSRTYQFAPDDFARMTLMESDGMNPKASNNRCHGIIQFCDGPDRGAASAGYGSNPKDILGKSVLEQLDMVAKYFDDTGLRSGGPTSLDDLYLTVLTPAARREKALNANLNIAGTQAQHLYVNRDTSAPITRHSILQGLYQNAMERLARHDAQSAAANPAALTSPPGGNATLPSANPSALNKAQALRIGAYLNQTYLR